MSTDFENELRDLFREKAEEAPLATPTLPAVAPQQVLRRSRRHQVGTVLGSAAIVVALIVGSVAGLTRILGDGGGDRDIGDGGYEVFQRTATVEAFTIASPSDWFLVNQWPLSMQIAVETSGGASSACIAEPGNADVECEDTPSVETLSPIPVPHGLPMLQLSNVDLGLTTNACEAGVPGDAAVLYVALDYEAAIGGIADPSIQEFTPGAGLPPEGDGPCGPGRYAYFTVNGERFFSWIGIGSGASDQDRGSVETSYQTMSAISDWTPTPLNATTPGYVIAGGTSGSDEVWRLELRPEGNSLDLSLEDGPAPTTLLTDGTVDPLTWAGTDPIFGAITRAATGVEFRPGAGNVDYDVGQSPVAGTILPVPPTLSSSDFDLFFIDLPQGYELGGRVIALGLVGSPSFSPPPVAEPRERTVELSGSFEGQGWRVLFSGAFTGPGSPCWEVTVDGPASEACPEPVHSTIAGPSPYLVGFDWPALHLLAGSVPPEVVEVQFVGDDDSIVPQQFRCAMGPLGWTNPDRNVCALALPPNGSGSVEYLDANGAVVFEEGIGWGAAEPQVPSATWTAVDPVHGGTYWAVYPWVGAAGSPDAENMSALLLEDFGIEAFPGDLSCDDGAAEALGTDAPQGIGVYFETEEDANAFALQAGLLGHEADPVIAQVTTYCLD